MKSGLPVFAVLLGLLACMLGTGMSSRVSSEFTALSQLATPAEFAARAHDGVPGDVPPADPGDGQGDDVEFDDGASADGDGNGNDGCNVAVQLNLALLLAPPSASRRSETWLASRYRSFVSEPSTPPPRA